MADLEGVSRELGEGVHVEHIGGVLLRSFEVLWDSRLNTPGSVLCNASHRSRFYLALRTSTGCMVVSGREREREAPLWTTLELHDGVTPYSMVVSSHIGVVTQREDTAEGEREREMDDGDVRSTSYTESDSEGEGERETERDLLWLLCPERILVYDIALGTLVCSLSHIQIEREKEKGGKRRERLSVRDVVSLTPSPSSYPLVLSGSGSLYTLAEGVLEEEEGAEGERERGYVCKRVAKGVMVAGTANAVVLLGDRKGHKDGSVTVYPLSSRPVTLSLPLREGERCTAVGAGLSLVCVGTSMGSIYVYDTRDDECSLVGTLHPSEGTDSKREVTALSVLTVGTDTYLCSKGKGAERVHLYKIPTATDAERDRESEREKGLVPVPVPVGTEAVVTGGRGLLLCHRPPTPSPSPSLSLSLCAPLSMSAAGRLATACASGTVKDIERMLREAEAPLLIAPHAVVSAVLFAAYEAKLRAERASESGSYIVTEESAEGERDTFAQRHQREREREREMVHGERHREIEREAVAKLDALLEGGILHPSGAGLTHCPVYTVGGVCIDPMEVLLDRAPPSPMCRDTSVSMPVLHLAVLLDNAPVVRWCLSHGFTDTRPVETLEREREGEEGVSAVSAPLALVHSLTLTPLHVACMCNSMSALHALLTSLHRGPGGTRERERERADMLYSRDSLLRTAFHCACTSYCTPKTDTLDTPPSHPTSALPVLLRALSPMDAVSLSGLACLKGDTPFTILLRGLLKGEREGSISAQEGFRYLTQTVELIGSASLCVCDPLTGMPPLVTLAQKEDTEAIAGLLSAVRYTPDETERERDRDLEAERAMRREREAGVAACLAYTGRDGRTPLLTALLHCRQTTAAALIALSIPPVTEGERQGRRKSIGRMGRRERVTPWEREREGAKGEGDGEKDYAAGCERVLNTLRERERDLETERGSGMECTTLTSALGHILESDVHGISPLHAAVLACPHALLSLSLLPISCLISRLSVTAGGEKERDAAVSGLVNAQDNFGCTPLHYCFSETRPLSVCLGSALVQRAPFHIHKAKASLALTLMGASYSAVDMANASPLALAVNVPALTGVLTSLVSKQDVSSADSDDEGGHSRRLSRDMERDRQRDSERERDRSKAKGARPLPTTRVLVDYCDRLKGLSTYADMDTPAVTDPLPPLDSLDSDATQSLLHQAWTCGNTQLVRLLLRVGNCDAVDGQGRTLLHLAAQAGDIVMVSDLIGTDCDKTVQDRAGDVALHVAAREGHQAVVALLLRARARVQAQTRNHDGLTPRDVASLSCQSLFDDISIGCLPCTGMARVGRERGCAEGEGERETDSAESVSDSVQRSVFYPLRTRSLPITLSAAEGDGSHARDMVQELGEGEADAESTGELSMGEMEREGERDTEEERVLVVGDALWVVGHHAVHVFNASGASFVGSSSLPEGVSPDDLLPLSTPPLGRGRGRDTEREGPVVWALPSVGQDITPLPQEEGEDTPALYTHSVPRLLSRAGNAQSSLAASFDEGDIDQLERERDGEGEEEDVVSAAATGRALSIYNGTPAALIMGSAAPIIGISDAYAEPSVLGDRSTEGVYHSGSSSKRGPSPVHCVYALTADGTLYLLKEREGDREAEEGERERDEYDPRGTIERERERRRGRQREGQHVYDVVASQDLGILQSRLTDTISSLSLPSFTLSPVHSQSSGSSGSSGLSHLGCVCVSEELGLVLYADPREGVETCLLSVNTMFAEEGDTSISAAIVHMTSDTERETEAESEADAAEHALQTSLDISTPRTRQTSLLIGQGSTLHVIPDISRLYIDQTHTRGQSDDLSGDSATSQTGVSIASVDIDAVYGPLHRHGSLTRHHIRHIVQNDDKICVFSTLTSTEAEDTPRNGRERETERGDESYMLVLAATPSLPTSLVSATNDTEWDGEGAHREGDSDLSAFYRERLRKLGLACVRLPRSYNTAFTGSRVGSVDLQGGMYSQKRERESGEHFDEGEREREAQMQQYNDARDRAIREQGRYIYTLHDSTLCQWSASGRSFLHLCTEEAGILRTEAALNRVKRLCRTFLSIERERERDSTSMDYRRAGRDTSKERERVCPSWARTFGGETPLMLATRLQATQTVSVLASCGMAHASVQTVSGVNALWIAAVLNSQALLSQVVAAGGDVTQELTAYPGGAVLGAGLLHILAATGDMQRLHRVLSCVDPSKVRLVVNTIAIGGWYRGVSLEGTPLHVACRANRVEMVDVLISRYEAVVNVTTMRRQEDEGERESGQTEKGSVGSRSPLHVALVHRADTRIVERLLKARAVVNAPDQSGKTPLILAVYHASRDSTRDGRAEDSVRLLIEAGADLAVQDNTNTTPLHQCAFLGSESLLRSMLEAHTLRQSASDESDASLVLNALNARGRTPLVLSVESHSIGKVQALLEYGAKVNHATTLLKRAQRERERERERDMQGDMNGGHRVVERERVVFPLHYAVRTGQRDIVRLLIEAGADPLAMNEDGETAYEVASDDVDILNLMLGYTRKSQGTAAGWVPDESAPKCQVCREVFSTTVRRHHCRNCGRVICDECSIRKVPITKFRRKERVCKQCKAAGGLDALTQFRYYATPNQW
ncbi:hypothetical protein KIPB_002095 [Kipferlia bialata]|uniref:FYVE-type domain-containing protein n=1 Tax=Kipferlia bialata TaxID=797122 RepID=A0A9K3GFM4_9EUKA|nr:hypothetical protein KIPB_002095 [Kipferlia bialata]|eukprot:g2095.t1